MCGIVGVMNTKGPGAVDQDLIARMITMIRHRGPDESGMYLSPYIGMGHARLSIIDLEGGTQPIGNEDGSLWMVYNGETYNYIELREELVKKGHRFSSETDTEVVLHLFEEFGPHCLNKMNGQFALAIWDASKQELFLARDRVGIRPLYFAHTGGKFLFASEIKAIFLDRDVEREIDLKALDQVFTFWTTLTPKTIFKDIFELPAGHFMIVSKGNVEQSRYWQTPYCSPEERWNGSYAEAEEELKKRLKDAVRLRLRADVPVGAYLSGGLDSSLITSLISKYFNNRLRTFSMGFQETAFDESAFQRDLVCHLGTEHSQTVIENSTIRKYFPEVVRHCEIPLLRTAPVPLFALSRLVRENHFKVVLTGEGADEIFGGYNIFKEAKVRYFWGMNPSSRLRPRLLERLYPYVFTDPVRSRFFLQKFYSVNPVDLKDPFFSHRPRWKSSGKNRGFFSDHVFSEIAAYDPLKDLITRLPSDFNSRDILSKAHFLETEIFLSNYLLSSQGDRMAMAHSLEIRLPYLDYRIMDFASRLPPKWKINGLKEKYILRKAANGLVPGKILERAKQPYRAPMREVFLSGKPPDYVNELLAENHLLKTNYFNAKKVRGLIARLNRPCKNANSEVQNMALVGILSTQLIHHLFIKNFPLQQCVPIKPDKVIRL